MARPCLYDCKTEGPPGPIWCTWCGHAPKCCNCEHPDDLKNRYDAVYSTEQEQTDAARPSKADSEADVTTERQ